MLCARLCSAVLVVVMAGCSTTQPEGVPETLLKDCTPPVVDPSTNAGLARGVLEYDAVLRDCNDDKAALRLYFNIKERK